MNRIHSLHAARRQAHALAFGLRMLAALAGATAWVLVARGLGAG